MGWVHHINEGKKDKKVWFYHRWFFHIGKNGNRDISIEICSTPSFGWGLNIEGDEGTVLIYFWFIFKFYIGFTGIFPEWIYIREYNQFSDKDPTPNDNKNLKRKYRTRDNGWIKTARRKTSIRFFSYSMWWNIWRDDNSWSSSVPKWRSGNFEPGRWIRGKEKYKSSVIDTFYAHIKMPEGIYQSTVEETISVRSYQRWFSKKWKRFEFKFGYNDENGEWISTPVLHWGKGESSYNCGMDGTWSMTLGADITDRSMAVARILTICFETRKKYGNVDVPKSTDGIVNGVVMKNLISEFS